MPEFLGAFIGALIGTWTYWFMSDNDLFRWDTDDDDDDYEEEYEEE